RIRASDNRRVPQGLQRDVADRPMPAQELTPHVIYHPELQGGKERWFLLKVDRQADSLAKQEIVTQKDDIHRRLTEIIKKLKAERGDLDRLAQASKDRPELSEAQTAALEKVRDQNQAITGELQQLALDTVQTPVLVLLASRINEVAVKEM